ELGEDEARDAAGAHVLHHAPRLGGGHDRLAGDAGQVVQGHDLPAADLRVAPRAVLVVLRALAFGLVLGRDPDPDRAAPGGQLFSYRTGMVRLPLILAHSYAVSHARVISKQAASISVLLRL